MSLARACSRLTGLLLDCEALFKPAGHCMQAQGTNPLGGAIFIEAPKLAFVSSAVFEANAVLVRPVPSLTIVEMRSS